MNTQHKPAKSGIDAATLRDIRRAAQLLRGVVVRLNNESSNCQTCGVTHYVNFTEHLLFDRLDGTVARLDGIAEDLRLQLLQPVKSALDAQERSR